MNLELIKKYLIPKHQRRASVLVQQYAIVIGPRIASVDGQQAFSHAARIRLSIIFHANSIVIAGIQNYVCNALFYRKHYERLELLIQRCHLYPPVKSTNDQTAKHL